MAFLLSTRNVIEYLIDRGLCAAVEPTLGLVQPILCKNFNLRVSWPNDHSLLVKQEPHDPSGQSKGDFAYEWKLYEFLQYFSELQSIRQLISAAIHFDPTRSLLVFNYCEQYRDLEEFYAQEHRFPSSLAGILGTALATIHRSSIDRPPYQDFLRSTCPNFDQKPNFLRGLADIKPAIFGHVTTDGLKFFELYQRFPSLAAAIAELNAAYEPCCLTHNDLKLDNLLLRLDWETAITKNCHDASAIIRFIDWEKWRWGDPGFDLGMLIASYLKIWLGSLAINTDIDVETALQLTDTSLELLQPSIATIIQAYLAQFPAILQRRPDFLNRVAQFAGLALIERLRARIHYLEPFGNFGVCMLQVAKTLLCQPEQSLPSIFGMTASELTDSANVLRAGGR